MNPRDSTPPADTGKPGTPRATDDGVDVSLIRWMLSMSPAQRLAVLQKNANSILRLRSGRSRA